MNNVNPSIRISDGAIKANVSTVRNVDTVHGRYYFELKDIFTTQDGNWYKTLKLFSIPQWAIDAYIGNSLDAGAATHLFALVLDLDGAPIEAAPVVYQNGQGAPFDVLTKRSGWSNQGVTQSYNPDRGERGAWQWGPKYADFYLVGGGLPFQWHVSTMGVWQKRMKPLSPVDPVDPVDPPTEPSPHIVNLSLQSPTTIQIKTNRQPFVISVLEG